MSTRYHIAETFTSIQGEGVNAGKPAHFIRLQGCNLNCPWCDTPEAKGKSMAWGEWANAKWLVDGIPPHIRLVVLTGGEPALQDLACLVSMLHGRGKTVAIETNGTCAIPVRENCELDWVCVSPKLGCLGGAGLSEATLRKADELKFVIGDVGDLQRMDAWLQSQAASIPAKAALLLQPMSREDIATSLCVKEVERRGWPWQISVQLHRVIGVR